MESLNRILFLWLNAPEYPNPLLLELGRLFGEYAIGFVPALIGIGWLRGTEHTRKVLLNATASGLAGLFINQMVGLIWQHPRPFMIGLGNTFISHVADSSFPSDHLTLLWAVAFSLLTHRYSRITGIALAVLGLPVAWARIYVGVHFPFDMFGAVVVAVISTWLTLRAARWYLVTVYRLAISIHRQLLGRLIARGWVRE